MAKPKRGRATAEIDYHVGLRIRERAQVVQGLFERYPLQHAIPDRARAAAAEELDPRLQDRPHSN